MKLIDPDLGELELRNSPYGVVSFQIGSRAPRAVVRSRALADGTFDDTRYSGARAVTVQVRLDEQGCRDGTTMQGLLDRLLPYMEPWRRPILQWSLPGTDGVVRQMVVRGEDAPVAIAAPKHPTVALQFVSDGTITSPDLECLMITPATDTESGRVYDRAYDRTYPPGDAIGDRLVHHVGNGRADWVGTIFGPVDRPIVRVNDVTINFDLNGGVNIPAGASVVIDTKARTIWFNGDPAFPRYAMTNFTQWTFDDLKLRAGRNRARFASFGVMGVGSQMNMCWYPTWVG